MLPLLIMELKHAMTKVYGNELTLAVPIHYTVYFSKRISLLLFQTRQFLLKCIIIATAYLASYL